MTGGSNVDEHRVGADEPPARQRVREALVGYGFIAIRCSCTLVLFLYPIGYAIYISRYDWGALGPIDRSGSAELPRLLIHDERFHIAMKNGLKFTISFTIGAMALGLFVAVVVNNAIHGRSFFRVRVLLPVDRALAAITAIAIYILSIDGLFNKIIGATTSRGSPTRRRRSGSIVGLNSWTTSGTIMLFYLAYLQAIPTDVYEAAAIDGAGAWRTFWKVTFPLLKPGHFFVSTLLVIGGLKMFDQAYIVVGRKRAARTTRRCPRPLPVPRRVLRRALRVRRRGRADAVVLMIALTLVQRLLFGRGEAAYRWPRAASGSGRRSSSRRRHDRAATVDRAPRVRLDGGGGGSTLPTGIRAAPLRACARRSSSTRSSSAIALLYFVPFLWTVSTSLKTLPETRASACSRSTRRCMRTARRSTTFHFARYAANSAGLRDRRHAAQRRSSRSLGGYAFARLKFPGRELLFLGRARDADGPRPAPARPVFEMFGDWAASSAPTTATSSSSSRSAAQLFLMRQYFLTIPKDLEEAAKLDGAGYFKTFWRVMLPLAGRRSPRLRSSSSRARGTTSSGR